MSFLWAQNKLLVYPTSVGRFSNADPVLYPVLISVVTMRTDRHVIKCENRTENGPQVLTWSRTGYENRFKCVHVYVYMGGGTGSLVELRSGSRSLVMNFIRPKFMQFNLNLNLIVFKFDLSILVDIVITCNIIQLLLSGKYVLNL